MKSLYWKKNSTPAELRRLLETLSDCGVLTETERETELVFEASSASGTSAVKFDGARALITYSSVATAARAIGCALAGSESDEKKPFKTLGIMLDCSRNAVLTVEHGKSWLRQLCLLGYDTVMLYTEDTYRLPGEEYFGYMRGAYSLEEIRELNTFACSLGLRLIPCIQTLGHMEQVLKWSAYEAVKDNDAVLLVDEEKTYQLIEKMIQFWKEATGCERIHIGMDEAHGLGRGRFMDINGPERSFDIFNRHLGRVGEICRRHGLRPMIWSDMYFRMGNPEHDYYRLDSEIPADVVSSIPQDVDIVYWDYYNKDEKFYSEFIEKHKALGHEPVMASGIWTWMRLWCDQTQSEKTVLPCLRACRDKGITELIFTLWGDNGGCCDLDSALAGLCWAAEAAYGGNRPTTEKLEQKFQAVCGGSYRNYLAASELENYMVGGFKDSIGIQCLLWDDPLQGIFWNNERLANPNFADELQKRYDRVCAQLAPFRDQNQAGDLNHAWLIADFLRRKISCRKTLEAAYHAKDREALAGLAERDLPELLAACERLSESFRKVWLRCYKPFGLEVVQIRQGGQELRLKETIATIKEYLNDKILRIEELEEKVTTRIEKSYGYYRYWSTGSTTI